MDSRGLLLIFIHCISLLHGNNVGKCEFPFVEGAFFNESDSKEVKLIRLNSFENLNEEVSFPYQYVMLTCSASYPIHWATNLPERYFYSYILDDEVRIKRPDNSSNFNKTSPNEVQQYGVRLHIGNETLARKDFKSMIASCQPMYRNVNDTAASLEKKSCGTTLFSLEKYQTIDVKNASMIKVKLENEVDSDRDVDTKRVLYDNITEICIKDEEWEEPINGSVRSQFICELSDLPEDNSTVLKNISLAQLQFRKSSLHASFGNLYCVNAKEYNTDNNIIPQPQETFIIPYYFSLPPGLCTAENSTSNLYFRRSSSEACSANDLVNENELLCLSVQNSFAKAKDIYVGDRITVTCFSSIYYFANGMQIGFVNKEGSVQPIKETSSLKEHENANGMGGFRNLTKSFLIDNDEFNEIQCMAPVKKSRKWSTKLAKIEIKVPIKLSFDNSSQAPIEEDGSTFFDCNATGDPVPELIWSRLNQEMLPSNSSTEIRTFPTSANKSGKNATWISSKLYIPNNKSEKELSQYYYGRYICIAKNRFSSIEKIFLFDGNETRNGGFSQNGIIQNMGKSQWFWMGISLSILILIGFVILLGWKLREQGRNLRLFTKAEIEEFMLGRPELLLDDCDNYEEINSYAAYLPYDRNQFEIRRDQLDFNPTDILGCGAYGTVYKGIFTDYKSQTFTVAIKTVNSSSDKIYFAALLSEIKIMCFIDKHENVVGLIGACTKYLDKRQIFVATEFCENGDILSYIQKHREVIIHNASTGLQLAMPFEDRYCQLSYVKLLLSPRLLLTWAHQIANGMTFLSSKKVIHGDLAARNILLASDLKPKIGDFGLSKQLQKYSNYVQKGDDLVPWRWLAIECLQFMKFSIKSDVWAFGIVLYEILSLGQVPYANHTYSELFIVSLCQGERPPKPLYANDKIYELMLNCWRNSPEDRPSFLSLENSLKTLMLDKDNFLSSTTPPIRNSSSITTPYSSIVPKRQIIARYVNTSQVQKKRGPNLYIDNSDPDNAILHYVKSQCVTNGMSSRSPVLDTPTTSYVDWTAMM